VSLGWGESGDGALTGNVTNIHITDFGLDGPIPRELCLFPALRELDIDGGHFSGPVPDWLLDCFPGLQELDLSYNRVRTLKENLPWSGWREGGIAELFTCMSGGTCMAASCLSC
jgi:hypothetical protein